MKQTAVEWFIEQITKQPIENMTDEEWFGIMGQAKEMDKEQKMDAYDWGRADEKNMQENIVAPQYNNADEFYAGEYGGEQ